MFLFVTAPHSVVTVQVCVCLVYVQRAVCHMLALHYRCFSFPVCPVRKRAISTQNRAAVTKQMQQMLSVVKVLTEHVNLTMMLLLYLTNSCIRHAMTPQTWGEKGQKISYKNPFSGHASPNL
ncbi:hypothetical protein WMY93_004643 [Mugilogobius chulae]|uniref:Secreted protein n=1 Tax=Mugilogobius chulae TaxID=88201 RepID=A0AAW0PQ87_9GOBI